MVLNLVVSVLTVYKINKTVSDLCLCNDISINNHDYNNQNSITMIEDR